MTWRKRFPEAGACGGQYTANTMAMTWFLGLSPWSSAGPPPSTAAGRVIRPCRRLVMELLERGLPRSAS